MYTSSKLAQKQYQETKMDFETLFTSTKWEILDQLSKKSYSPLELSKILNTSMANISQQLRLLEALNLVKKEKVSNRDKGKPRTLYSLSADYAYIIVFANGIAEKKLVKLNASTKSSVKKLLN